MADTLIDQIVQCCTEALNGAGKYYCERSRGIVTWPRLLESLSALARGWVVPSLFDEDEAYDRVLGHLKISAAPSRLGIRPVGEFVCNIFFYSDHLICSSGSGKGAPIPYADPDMFELLLHQVNHRYLQ